MFYYRSLSLTLQWFTKKDHHEQPDKKGFLPVNGAKLYYEVIGAGFPLVLVHSRWMHNVLWNEQVRAFAPHYRVIRYDVRGLVNRKWN